MKRRSHQLPCRLQRDACTLHLEGGLAGGGAQEERHQNWPGDFGNRDCLRSEIGLAGGSDSKRNVCENNPAPPKRISRIPGQCS